MYLGLLTLNMSFGSWFLFQCTLREFMKHKDWRLSKEPSPASEETHAKKHNILCTAQRAHSLLLPFHDLNAPETYRANVAQTGQWEIPSQWLQQRGPGGTAPSGEEQSCLHVFESLVFTSGYFNIISCQWWRNYQKALISAHLTSSYGLT